MNNKIKQRINYNLFNGYNISEIKTEKLLIEKNDKINKKIDELKILFKKENKENIINNRNNPNFIYHKKNAKYIPYKDNLKENIKKIINYKKKERNKRNNKSFIDKNNFSYSLSLSPGVPYRKVGNVFSRNECQFNKKNINNIKQSFIKSNSCKSFNISCDDINKIKKLEGENYYLKKMIKIKEEKINKKKKLLEKLLILQNHQEYINYITPKENISKVIYPVNKDSKNKKDNLYNNIIKYNYNKIKYLHSEEFLIGFLEEPQEQVAPIPYVSNNKY